jgi:hypothetical protein
MMTMRVATVAAGLAVALSVASARAEGPKASSSTAIVQAADEQPTEARQALPHYEWQYHYVGHHGRFEGYWALVR